MAHSLRKYLSNRGSALFMVISTMTALMIACMAMYFSVISARTTQFATFFREQSYQSAVSLNDMVLAGLMDGTLTSGDKDLLSTLAGMNEGETITTGANGFSSFDSTLTGSDIAQMGAYSMDITRLPNEMVNGKDNMTFDIATTTINNGVADTVHTYIHVEMADEDIPNGDNIFTATGYVPNDAFLDAGKFMTDVFFDTEYTYISLYGNACVFAGALNTGGSLILHQSLTPLTDGTNLGGTATSVSGILRPVTWSIRGDFKIDFNGQLEFMSGSKIFVGGDLNFPNGGGFKIINSDGTENNSGSIDVYVLGDLNMGSCGLGLKNVNMHVQGNVSSGQVGTAKNIYINGNDNSTEHTDAWSPVTHPKWSESTIPAGDLTFEAARTELNRTTYSKTYRKWVINGEDSTKNDYHDGISTKDITIKVNSSHNYTNNVEGLSTVFTIAHHNAASADTIAAAPDTGAVCVASTKNSKASSATIKEVIGDCNGLDEISGVKTMNTIVLDTGEDEDNMLILRVSGYMTDSNGNNVFKWFPTGINSGCTVLVKGKGIVIIDIPEGVVYQDCDRQQFMHYSWFTLLGGVENDVTADVQTKDGTTINKTVHVYDSTKIQDGSAAEAVKYIHTKCTKGDGCSYSTESVKDSSGKVVKCTKHPKQDMLKVKCSVSGHETTSIPNFCPECDKFNAERVDKLIKKTYDFGVCANRLDETKVDLSKCPDGILPNTDIFLVSCAESAEIRLSGSAYDPLNPYASIIQNGFYGFIYAPYMTFKAEGSSGLGANRFCGGLIVSDYAIDDHYAFTNMYPSKMPNDLMGDSSDILDGMTDKSWKINLGGY